MLHDVVHRFFERQKHVVSQVGRNDRCGQLGRHLQPVTQSGQGEIFLRILAGVIDQTLQGVILRIRGPDDLVEGARGVAGGLGNLFGVRLDFLRQMPVLLGHFPEQRHLGQIRAQLIVQVAGDAGALFFQGLLLAHQCELPLESLRGDEVNHPHDRSEQT